MSEQMRKMRLKDRPEFKRKSRPLTCPLGTSVRSAVAMMADHNYGSILVVDMAGRLVGILTERDILKRLVNEERAPDTTLVETIMTQNPQVARENDAVLDWMQVMANERFRRLPVVNAQGEAIAIFTQSDFVTYTWEDLFFQVRMMARATALQNFPTLVIGGGLALYTIIMVLLLRSF